VRGRKSGRQHDSRRSQRTDVHGHPAIIIEVAHEPSFDARETLLELLVELSERRIRGTVRQRMQHDRNNQAAIENIRRKEPTS
jgi:hypothetical protein